jgi:hypothetical protein
LVSVPTNILVTERCLASWSGTRALDVAQQGGTTDFAAEPLLEANFADSGVPDASSKAREVADWENIVANSALPLADARHR